MSTQRKYHRPFDELKKLVGIDEVAQSIGFKLDAKEGRGKYVTFRRDFGGNTETIRIANPRDKEHQVYFTERNQTRAGTVVQFILEHELEFNQDRGADKWDTAGAVLERMANMPAEEKQKWNSNNYLVTRPFNSEEYETHPVSEDISNSMRFFEQRGIRRDTVELFAKNIVRIKDLQSQVKFLNIGFPYRKPGSDTVVGYEIRGIETQDGRKFKTKARGTDSTTALWCTDFCNGNNADVSRVYFAESAYDIMAFVQANRDKIDVAHAAFASVGGTFSDQQVMAVMKHYNHAAPVDCFDNDITGIRYGCRMALLAESITPNINILKDQQLTRFTVNGNTFDIPDSELSVAALNRHINTRFRMTTMKPPKDFKDWNDVILNRPFRLTEQTGSKEQMNENLFKKRNGGMGLN